MTVTSSKAGRRTCSGESSAKCRLLIEFGETVAEFVFFMMAGKNNTHAANQSKILGCVVQPQIKWTQEASVARAPAWREHRALSKNGTSGCTHIDTMKGFPSKRQSSLWKKMVTDALKSRSLRDCRGAVAPNTHRLRTHHVISRGEKQLGQGRCTCS